MKSSVILGFIYKYIRITPISKASLKHLFILVIKKKSSGFLQQRFQ